MLEDYMTTTEAAQKWGLTGARVRELCLLKKVESIMFQNRYLIKKDHPNPKIKK